VTHWLA